MGQEVGQDASRVVAVDMLGQEYGVGDFVVYATTSGRCPVLKYAAVHRVNRVTLDGGGTAIRVGVREIKNGRGFSRWDSYDWKTGVRDMAKVRITYPMTENIVKVQGAE